MNTPLALATLCLAAVSGASDDITEVQRFGPLNLGDNASFGHSIATNFTHIATGAPFLDLNGLNSGAVYLHITETGQQLFRLTAPDAGEGDQFGISVAMGASRVIVGALRADGAADATGAVYIFDTQTGAFLNKITVPDGEQFDDFGRSVGTSGSRVIVGSPQDGDNGPASGSAYIYDLVTGTQLRKLTASDAEAFARFGSSVAISSVFAVVGAEFDDFDEVRAGAAYVFNAFNGQQLHKFTPTPPPNAGQFGLAVAIRANLVVVGAREVTADGITEGAAYVFDAATGEQLHRLTSPAPVEFQDAFGRSVAISGNLIVVGAPSDAVDGVLTGSAFVFDAESGQKLYRLIASDGAAEDALGASVAVLGTQAFVGSPTAEAPIGPDSGASYVLDITPCFADVNGDNTVDLADLNIILAAFGQSTTDGDTNFDGVVDLADLNRVLSEFGTECP